MDAQAFAASIREWDHDLRAMVWSVVRSGSATDEVMHASYAQVFGARDRVEGSGELHAAVRSACLRNAIDYSKRNGRGSGESQPAMPLDELAPVDQLLAMLTSGLGTSIDDTSTLVGMDRDTVVARVASAQAQLGARVDDVGDLREHLQACVPQPRADYWPSIERQLGVAPVQAVVAEAPDAAAEVTGDDDFPGLSEERSWNTPLLWGAVALVVVGLAVWALFLRSADDTADSVVSDAEPQASVAVDATPIAANADLDAAVAVAARDASPLRALQARVDAEPDAATTAGPYCFASDDALVFPANEIADRRGFVWMEIEANAVVHFYGLQGTTIVIEGFATPDGPGEFEPGVQVIAGASGAPLYTMTIEELGVRFGDADEIPLVDCAEVSDRVETLFGIANGEPAPTLPTIETADWPPADAVLSSAGLGPIRVGMTVSELGAVVGADLTIETIDGNVAGECGYVTINAAINKNVEMLVELTSPTDGIIRRVSVIDGRWRTPSGMFVGATEQQVIDTFPGQIEISPHLYVEGNYLTYIPSNASDPNTVQFVSKAGTIAQIHAGDRVWARLVEGCA